MLQKSCCMLFFGLLMAVHVFGQTAATKPEQRLKELGLTLPKAEKPVANFVKWVRTGNLVFLSGHGFCGPATAVDRGKLGRDLTTKQGYEAAKRVALCMLATLQDATGGDLSKVKQVVRVHGMVNSAEDFYDQPKVINGCSDLLTQVFGEKGKHTRVAVGMASLPNNLAVEIEMVVELED